MSMTQKWLKLGEYNSPQWFIRELYKFLENLKTASLKLFDSQTQKCLKNDIIFEWVQNWTKFAIERMTLA